jgi:hypothetical protein
MRAAPHANGESIANTEGPTTVTVVVTTAVPQATGTVYDITVVPVVRPYTVAAPPLTPSVPTVGTLLLHVPPGVASVNVVMPPQVIVVVPTIGAAVATLDTETRKVDVAVPQAVVAVYVNVVVPAATPVTIPEVTPTVATPGVLLLHVPPDTVLVAVVVAPTHIVVKAVMVPAVPADTVTTLVTVIVPQPVVLT